MSEERVSPQMSPYPVEVVEGKRYFWCRCGRSENQPFCDGAHKDTGIEPLAWTATKSETIMFCGCKQTDDEPFCDGSHNMY